MRNTEDQSIPESQWPCLCAAVRKAGRLLTRQYDRHLKPSGLKVTQYSMLANIGRNPGITVSDLATLLMMDQTTVTRNLALLDRDGLVKVEPDQDDRRVRRVWASARGTARLQEAKPLWDQAQQEVEQALSRSGVDSLLEVLGRLETE